MAIRTIGDLLIRTTENGDCLNFTGSKNKHGYGQVGFNGMVYLAHRVSYILAFGEIPAGLCVLHKCDNPPCINPDHLFSGTRKDNTQDMIKKGRKGSNIEKAFCKRGHPFSGENLKFNRKGGRYCRECNRINSRLYNTLLKNFFYGKQTDANR